MTKGVPAGQQRRFRAYQDAGYSHFNDSIIGASVETILETEYFQAKAAALISRKVAMDRGMANVVESDFQSFANDLHCDVRTLLEAVDAAIEKLKGDGN